MNIEHPLLSCTCAHMFMLRMFVALAVKFYRHRRKIKGIAELDAALIKNTIADLSFFLSFGPVKQGWWFLTII